MNVLVLSPHTDDAELGCGGTLWAYRHDWQVTVAVFCDTYTDTSKIQILEENLQALNKLGVDERRRLYGMKARSLPQYRQYVLDQMIKLRDELHPVLVFCPATTDCHQDHQVICNEAIRAFKHTTLLGYGLWWNSIPKPTDTRLYISLPDSAVTAKLSALRVYESQKHRSYMSETLQTTILTANGSMVGAAQAEAFEVIRQIWRGKELGS